VIRMSLRYPAFLLLFALFSIEPAEGQTFIEVRNGLTIGSHTATGAGLEVEPAYSFEVLAARRFGSSMSVYGGYSRTKFGCAEGFCSGRDVKVTGSHATVGLELRKGPWVRFGLLFGTTRVGTQGDAAEAGLGFRAGTGFAFGMRRLRIRPGISYSWMSANTSSRKDHAIAVSLELGVGIPVG
jgi:hypothetical protein